MSDDYGFFVLVGKDIIPLEWNDESVQSNPNTLIAYSESMDNKEGM